VQLQRTMALLVHACSCNSHSCARSSCRNMRSLLQHDGACQKKASGGCQLCFRMRGLLKLHVKHCTRDDCAVPHCKYAPRRPAPRSCGPLFARVHLLAIAASRATVAVLPGEVIAVTSPGGAAAATVVTVELGWHHCEAWMTPPFSTTAHPAALDVHGCSSSTSLYETRLLS
jgi:hypothetical protein